MNNLTSFFLSNGPFVGLYHVLLRSGRWLFSLCSKVHGNRLTVCLRIDSSSGYNGFRAWLKEWDKDWDNRRVAYGEWVGNIRQNRVQGGVAHPYLNTMQSYLHRVYYAEIR